MPAARGRSGPARRRPGGSAAPRRVAVRDGDQAGSQRHVQDDDSIAAVIGQSHGVDDRALGRSAQHPGDAHRSREQPIADDPSLGVRSEPLVRANQDRNRHGLAPGVSTVEEAAPVDAQGRPAGEHRVRREAGRDLDDPLLGGEPRWPMARRDLGWYAATTRPSPGRASGPRLRGHGAPRGRTRPAGNGTRGCQLSFMAGGCPARAAFEPGCCRAVDGRPVCSSEERFAPRGPAFGCRALLGGANPATNL